MSGFVVHKVYDRRALSQFLATLNWLVVETLLQTMNTHCCEYFPGHRRRSMGRRVGNVIMGHLFSFNPKCPSTTFSRITDVTELRPGVIWSRSITTSASSSAINHNTTEAESPPPHTELLTDELERTIRLWWLLFCWPVMCESKRIHTN